MFSITFLLIFLILSLRFLILFIQKIRTGDPNENNSTYWMFSYDFRSSNKDWIPEDKVLLMRKRKRNFLVFILYINAILIFLTFNSFLAHLLEIIITDKFYYPV